MPLQFEVTFPRRSPVTWIIAIVLGILVWMGIERVFYPSTASSCSGSSDTRASWWDLRPMWE